MNYISFSLYGNNPKYTIGAIENAKFIDANLNDWSAIFYCAQDVGENIIDGLLACGATVLRQSADWHPNGMFWRFQATWDLDYQFLIFRDTDSRISNREMSALVEWQQSGKLVHIMRDHPYHRTKILGGMWGIRSEAKAILPGSETMKLFGEGHGQDQFYLANYVYPRVRNETYVHDSFFMYEKTAHPFADSRINGEFIGESLDENGEFSQLLRDICSDVESSHLKRFMLKFKSRLFR
jgi:hypothetical protein